MPHGHSNVGPLRATEVSNSVRHEKLRIPKATSGRRPRNSVELSGTAKRRGSETTSSTSKPKPSATSTVVHETGSNTDTLTNTCKHGVNATVSVPANEEKKDNDRQRDDLEQLTQAEADNDVVEVSFVVPERHQTAEDFDLRKFTVDVEQLVASLQAVIVRRQAAEDFEGDNLDEMVSAVVGTMHNFTAFVGRVYDLLETVRGEMKSATDLMRRRIIQPTECSNLTFKGQFHFIT